jgi:cell division septal protein FtsQ
MPPRRNPTPEASEEETPFQPSEPWWRKSSSPAREEPVKRERAATRFEASTPHVAEKQRPVKLSTIRVSGRAVAFVGVCVAMIVGLAVVLTNDNFTVTRELTTIRGLERVAEDDVRRASQLEGTNIFRVRPGQVAKAIKQVPGVPEARVHVWLPAQIVIDIREHTPLVAWHYITNTVWLAESGAVVPANGDLPPLKLEDPSGAAADANGKLRPYVLANLKALQAAGLEITNLFYGTYEGIYFRSPEGWTVYLGNEGKMDAKLAALRELRSNNVARTARATTVDLRIDGRMQLK